MNTRPIHTVPAGLAARGINVTPHVVRELCALSETGGTLFFEKGEYHFYEDGALHGFFAPSNNASGKKNVCFPVLDAADITVDGGGSVFVFHGNAFPFIVSESADVILKNFTCDTFLPSVAALEISEKTEEGFCCRINRALTPYRTADGHLVFERENGALSTADGKLSLHSLDRLSICYLFAGDTEETKESLAARFISADAFDLGDKLYFRYREDSEIACPYDIGERVVINLEEKRGRAVFFFENSERVTVENVVLRRGGGMGLIAQMCADVTVKGMRTDKAFHGDSVTLTADAFHLVNCYGTFTLEDCDMESFLDDACNVHGVYTVLDRRENGCLHAHFGHVQQDYFTPCKAGDRLAVIDPSTLDVVAEADVTDVYFTSNDGRSLSVKVNVLSGADRIQPGCLIENPARMPDVVFRNNRFRDFPHVLLSGAGKIRVEDNVFSDCTGGLVFRDLAGFWYESGRIRDLSVKDNDFCGGKETEVGAYIRIGVAGFDDARAPLIHKHIEIINNRFDKARPLAVSAGGAKELFVGGNTDGGKPLAPERVSVPNPAVRFRFSNSSKE